MNTTRRLKSYKIVILFVLCFGLPVCAAKLALAFAWYTTGIMAKGEWLDREIKFPVNNNSVWHLVYVVPSHCDDNCKLAIRSLDQIYVGLGKYQSRVEANVISTQPESTLRPVKSERLYWLQANDNVALRNELLILNPQGVALLRYKMVNSEGEAPELAKAIRTDLLRLLNYDRVELR